MKQESFRLTVDGYTPEPAEKVREFGDRLHTSMIGARRDVIRKLRLSAQRASKTILFSILFGLISFLSPAQDSTVCIKPSTARYYLEVEDEMYVLREKDTLQNLLIGNLREQVLTKDRIVRTYEMDSQLYADYIDNLFLESAFKEEETSRNEKRLVRQRNMAIGGGAGALIGSVIPGVGTLAGAMIGTGVGWVSSIFRKR